MATPNTQRQPAQSGGSDRSFGLVFATVFVAWGGWPLLHGGLPVAWSWALGLVFLAVALVRPAWLAPLNQLWTRFGTILHHLVSPVALAVLYFGTVVPTGLLLRCFKADPLHLRRLPEAPSYWIARRPPGPTPESLDNQF